MKRQLTAEQIAKRDARRAQFKALWKTVAAMSDVDRVHLASKYGIVTCEGHPLSLVNTILIARQNEVASIVGGFRQWIKQGRAVRKGEHGLMIWIPTGHRSETAEAAPAGDSANPTSEDDTRFIVGTVFDISQTEALDVAESAPEQDRELVAA